MKHLKTYEGLFDFFKKKNKPVPKVNGDLYEPIAARDMVEYEDNHKTVPFTKLEIDYINGLVGKVEYRRKMGKVYSVDHFHVETKNKNINIKKYDDEWFLVNIGINDNDIFSGEYIGWKYYKCDTFDGVKELMIDNGVRFFSK